MKTRYVHRTDGTIDVYRVLASGKCTAEDRVETIAPGANLYAVDGLCHNAQIGTYGHECGKPATWIGTKASGWQSGFCDDCKEHGDERRSFIAWEMVP